MKIHTKDILLTGSSGFVGSAVAASLVQQSGFNLYRAVRRSSGVTVGGSDVIIVPDFCDSDGWEKAVEGKDVVIHCAARVHIMNEISGDFISAFRKVNVQATATLARQAARAGVKRFIFISSIKVNGESAKADAPFSADDIPRPADAYGISKCEAEAELKKIGTESGMEVVIIRPVLVYGPGVKANFYSMMKWVHRGVPLPLGSVRNKRSLIFIDNLVDLVVRCIDHPAAGNQIFLASDGEDCSTTELLTYVTEAMGRSSRLIPLPEFVVRAIAILLGKGEFVERLWGSLVVDIKKTREVLEWSPPVGTRRAIVETVNHFLSEHAE